MPCRRGTEGDRGMDGSLAGRNVVVVGASSGIGRAAAATALDAGAHVVVAARRIDPLRDLAAGGAGVAVECDVRDPLARKTLAEVVARELGVVDVFLYTAATVPLVLMAE